MDFGIINKQFMKRYLACLIALMVALVAIGNSLVLQDGAQESLYDINPAESLYHHSQCEVAASFGHALAYAENYTTVQSVTATNYSPRSGYSTVSIGGNIPSPSFNGHNVEYKSVPTVGHPYRFSAKLYVLRV